MSVEQGVRFFRDEAFMEEAARGVKPSAAPSIPTYLVYSVGKLMLLKLRQDYKQQQGKAFRCARFTTRCSARAPRRSGSIVS